MSVQWEVSNRAFDVLKNTTDAKGRKIEVCKIRLPPPQFRNYREAEGLAVSVLAYCCVVQISTSNSISCEFHWNSCRLPIAGSHQCHVAAATSQ